MNRNNQKHERNLPQRKSIRLKGYDYSQPGLYFITIVTQNRKKLFGKIKNGKMILNNAGKMIEKLYYELENKYRNVKCREKIVMPNHFHCIIEIVESPAIVRADLRVCPNTGEHIGSPLQAMVQWFKTMTTNEYIRGVKNNRWQRFNKKLWQRNYWEHIIRDENEYMRISEYIINNPAKWEYDKLNDDRNIVMEPRAN